VHFEIRAAGNPEPLFGAVRKAIAEVAAELPILSARSVDDLVYTQNAQARMVAKLCAAFGIAAVLLAAIGLYGVLAYGVSRRTREMGIRMALGATRGRVSRMILREGGAMVVVGSVAGVAAAIATTRLVATRLYGVNPDDPATFSAALVAVALVALLASYLPAARAARTNPIHALRHE
jgi:ABC-type antimicrobial peptide transport system permease subunit